MQLYDNDNNSHNNNQWHSLLSKILKTGLRVGGGGGMVNMFLLCLTGKFLGSVTVAPCYYEDPVITNNIWKPARITVTYNLPRYNEYFVLLLAVRKNGW